MLFYPFYIFQPEFCLDDFHVAEGVDFAFDVNDFSIVEGTDDLKDTIDGTDMGQEGVSETCTSRRALGEV